MEHVTSQIKNHTELSSLAMNDHIVDVGTAMFRPIEATPPNYTEDHHICFTKHSATGVIYSQEVRVFQRKMENAKVHFANQNSTSDRTPSQNLSEAKTTFRELLKLSTNRQMNAYLNKIDDPIAALSIAAFLLLNLNLTYLRIK